MYKGWFFIFLLGGFGALWITEGRGDAANTQQKETEEEGFDFIGHLQDSHGWHLFTYGHHPVTLPLPVILYQPGKGWFFFSSSRFYDKKHQLKPYKGFKLEKEQIITTTGDKLYDFSITKNVASLLLSLLGLLLLFVGLLRYCLPLQPYQPRGVAVLLLYLVNFIRKLADEHIGKEQAARFTPYLLTLFFFILINNLLGLLPGAANTTGNISITLVLGIGSFLLINLTAPKAYWKHIFIPTGIPIIFYPLMVAIELTSLLVKPFTLVMRLFANILAGHMALLIVVMLTFAMKSAISKLSIALFLSLPLGSLVMLPMELFSSFLQAYIFTLLTAIYVGMAQESH